MHYLIAWTPCCVSGNFLLVRSTIMCQCSLMACIFYDGCLVSELKAQIHFTQIAGQTLEIPILTFLPLDRDVMQQYVKTSAIMVALYATGNHINPWISLHLLKLAPTNSHSILFSLLYLRPDSRSVDLFTPSIPKCSFSQSSFL